MEGETEIHMCSFQSVSQLCCHILGNASSLLFVRLCSFFLWDVAWGVTHRLILEFWCKPEHRPLWERVTDSCDNFWGRVCAPVPMRYSSWAGTNAHKSVRHLPAGCMEARTEKFIWRSPMNPMQWYPSDILTAAPQLHCGQESPMTLSTAGRLLLRSTQTCQAERAVAVEEKCCASL